MHKPRARRFVQATRWLLINQLGRLCAGARAAALLCIESAALDAFVAKTSDLSHCSLAQGINNALMPQPATSVLWLRPGA